ncbi:uncharacterized protein LOC121017974 isoform X1 [Herpailurus yagouaroundi]|uniref:uncharacterized protein LOC121017974 isoform X1 n=1 Tax=Herpailurus yagouaroundi TaxID=1608482 RepID=UPI001AD7BB58|nr:uncharacterized protein LOC121017974 isoform X1 [Puma yagouaroundi]
MAGAEWRPQLWARASARTKERDPAPVPPATQKVSPGRGLTLCGRRAPPTSLACPHPRGGVCAPSGSVPGAGRPERCDRFHEKEELVFPPGRLRIVASLVLQDLEVAACDFNTKESRGRGEAGVSSGPGGHGRSQRSRALTPGGPEKEKPIQPGGIIIPQNKCPGYVASTRKGTAPWGSGRRQILDLGWESAFLTRPVMLVLQDLSYIREAGASP